MLQIFLFVSPRWMPVVCWRRGWIQHRCLTVLQRHFPTHQSMLKPSCSRVRLYQLTMSWLAPASLTNTHASSSPSRLAPSTWSTGLSISPRTRWRCPGEHTHIFYLTRYSYIEKKKSGIVTRENTIQTNIFNCCGLHDMTVLLWIIQAPSHRIWFVSFKLAQALFLFIY